MKIPLKVRLQVGEEVGTLKTYCSQKEHMISSMQGLMGNGALEGMTFMQWGVYVNG